MKREELYEILKEKIQNGNLLKHMLAVEAVMRGLAKHFNEDEEKWALAGLAHDIDYQETMDKPSLHSIIGAEELKKMGFPDDIVYAVRVHNSAHGLERKTLMDKALYAADPVTGLIVAGALIHPDKKLKSIDTDFILSRFKEKRFAAGADRDQIQSCKDLGLSLREFIEIALKSMQEISANLGL